MELMYAETKPIKGIDVEPGFYIGPMAGGIDIAHVHLTASQNRETQEGFARLFAAAPDLLAACEKWKRIADANGYGRPGDDCYEMLVSAISKAKGE